MKILIICTGNSCRSQMAQGLLQAQRTDLEVFSAGTDPAEIVNPFAVTAMQEIGIDIRQNRPKSVNQYLADSWDYVITVCDHALDVCPVFSGKVKHRLHIGFDDPYLARGTEDFILNEYRRVRDEIRDRLVRKVWES